MIDEKGYKGCDIEKINLCAVEAVPSNIDAPKSTDIKRGMFVGICLHKLYDESVVTFILLKKNDSDIIALNLKHYGIVTIVVTDSNNVTEYRYYKATKQHQDEGFDFLSEILSTMIEQDKVIKNSEIIDTNLYIKKGYEELCVNIDELFPEDKKDKVHGIVKTMNNAFNNGACVIYNNRANTYGNQTHLTEYEKNRKKEEALKAERQRLKEIPTLIRKRIKDVEEGIIEKMLMKIKQIADGTYTAPELPALFVEHKEESTGASDDSEDHTQHKTISKSTTTCSDSGDICESHLSNAEIAFKNLSKGMAGFI